jgi:sugar phosphate isomerase/epimerase
MNRDEILAIAREIGYSDGYDGIELPSEESIIAFASRIEAATREECAIACEQLHRDLLEHHSVIEAKVATQCAAAIRKSEG